MDVLFLHSGRSREERGCPAAVLTMSIRWLRQTRYSISTPESELGPAYNGSSIFYIQELSLSPLQKRKPEASHSLKGRLISIFFFIISK